MVRNFMVWLNFFKVPAFENETGQLSLDTVKEDGSHGDR